MGVGVESDVRKKIADNIRIMLGNLREFALHLGLFYLGALDSVARQDTIGRFIVAMYLRRPAR